MLKKIFFIFLVLIVLIAIYFNLPIEITRSEDIKRGETLVSNIMKYKTKNGKLPKNEEVLLLDSIGFTKNEIERAYPEFNRINDSTFQLIFVLGFDPPYLIWDSREKEWSEKFPEYINQKN